MDENEVTRIATQVATDVYQKYGNRFGVNQTPRHQHTGVDAPAINSGDVNGFNNLSSQGNGVLSPSNIGDRIVLWNQASLNVGGIQQPLGNQAIFTTFPLVIVNGDLGEESLDFQGGEAPDGTLIFYKTGDTWQLWVRLFGTWHGCAFGAAGDPVTSLETSN